jgi:hypothetical protein
MTGFDPNRTSSAQGKLAALKSKPITAPPMPANAVDQVGSSLADQCDAGGVAKAFSKRDRNLGVSG